MLSYQHIYHAGNPADIHKHTVLLLLLRRLVRRHGRMQYLETHAGRGVYDLTAMEARKTREFADGIGHLADRRDGGPALQDLLGIVRAMNRPGQLRWYPGSPWIATQALGERDRMILCELHPRERAFLEDTMPWRDRRITIAAEDGWQRLERMEAPAGGGTLVLIDPSWELKDEYWSCPELALPALERLGASASALIWYPLLPDARHEVLLQGFAELTKAPILSSTLDFPGEGPGMQGSGLLLVNPPTGAHAAIGLALQSLPAALFPQGGARHRLETLQPSGG